MQSGFFSFFPRCREWVLYIPLMEELERAEGGATYGEARLHIPRQVGARLRLQGFGRLTGIWPCRYICKLRSITADANEFSKLITTSAIPLLYTNIRYSLALQSETLAIHPTIPFDLRGCLQILRARRSGAVVQDR